MKTILIVILVAFSICLHGQIPNSTNSLYSAGFVNKKKIGSIKGITINYFLNDQLIHDEAKKFYSGNMVVSANFSNCTFLDSILTTNNTNRPFHFFIFNSIVYLANEYQNEKLSRYCVAFIEKYPCDFFEMLEGSDLEINVVKWTNLVGIKLSNQQTYLRFKKAVDGKMAGCSNNTDLWVSFFSEARKSRIR